MYKGHGQYQVSINSNLIKAKTKSKAKAKKKDHVNKCGELGKKEREVERETHN
jgi:hypothetical protein